MKALSDLSKEELLTFIYNHEPGDINIFDKLASCACCGEPDAKYYYECENCQGSGDDDARALNEEQGVVK